MAEKKLTTVTRRGIQRKTLKGQLRQNGCGLAERRVLITKGRTPGTRDEIWQKFPMQKRQL